MPLFAFSMMPEENKCNDLKIPTVKKKKMMKV